MEQRLEEKNYVQPVVQKYAQRHYQRAIDFANIAYWTRSVQELRDAIKLEPRNSDYHALLGFVHLQQNFPGMATVYMRQALKLNPRGMKPTKNEQPLSKSAVLLRKLSIMLRKAALFDNPSPKYGWPSPRTVRVARFLFISASPTASSVKIRC